MEFKIDNKQIEIFYNETENKKIPVIIKIRKSLLLY